MGRDAAKVRVTIYDDCNVDCEDVNLSKESGRPDRVAFHRSSFHRRV